MNSDFFSEFILVGGTALALQIGHRNSIDLDFFGKREIDVNLFKENLEKFGTVTILKKSKNILIASVNTIKVDFVNYNYPIVSDSLVVDKITLSSKEDIAAMKLNAIAGRGSKKDFIDLYFLLDFFTLKQMIEFYRQKYTQHSEFSMLKSLTYFEDADIEEAPEMFLDFDWHLCKEKIQLAYDTLEL